MTGRYNVKKHDGAFSIKASNTNENKKKKCKIPNIIHTKYNHNNILRVKELNVKSKRLFIVKVNSL